MKIINLTPHAISVVAGDDNHIVATYPASGRVARASVNRQNIGDIVDDAGNAIPVSLSVFGEVQNLPEPEEDTIYIVSVLTAQAAYWRDDLYVTDDAVRDGEGRIIGCRGLAQL